MNINKLVEIKWHDITLVHVILLVNYVVASLHNSTGLQGSTVTPVNWRVEYA